VGWKENRVRGKNKENGVLKRHVTAQEVNGEKRGGKEWGDAKKS